MSKTSYDHDHVYQAVTPKLRQYKCTIQDCTHLISANLLLGRRAKCAGCKDVIPQVTRDMMRRTNITCLGCGRNKFMPNLPVTETDEAISKLLNRASRNL